MGIIMNRMLKNERLKRLLYYTTKDALKRPNLTEEESLSLIGKNIKMVPKLYVDKELLNYVIVRFDNFCMLANLTIRIACESAVFLSSFSNFSL